MITQKQITGNRDIVQILFGMKPVLEYDLFTCMNLGGIFSDVEADDPSVKHFYRPEEMLFHTNWNWLMCAVSKALDTDIAADDAPYENLLILKDALSDSSRVGTYDALINFIKSLNETYG